MLLWVVCVAALAAAVAGDCNVTVVDNTLVGVCMQGSPCQSAIAFGRNIANISSNAFEYCTGLTYLDLGMNKFLQLTANMFSGATSLQTLLIGSNDIANIDPHAFSNLASLHSLDLSDNNLTLLVANNFAGATNLANLYLGQNHINSIDPHALYGLPNLWQLSLWNNSLTLLVADSFAGPNGLVELYLFGNDITSIDPHAFNYLPKLGMLGLSDNSFNTLDPIVFAPLVSISVIVLTLTRSVPSGLFMYTPSLRYVVYRFANDDVGYITPCPPGQYVQALNLSLTGSITCAPCAAGSYQDVAWQPSCKPVSVCEQGTYGTAAPTTSSDRVCTACPAETYSRTLGALACMPWRSCSPGAAEVAAPTSSSDRVCMAVCTRRRTRRRIVPVK